MAKSKPRARLKPVSEKERTVHGPKWRAVRAFVKQREGGRCGVRLTYEEMKTLPDREFYRFQGGFSYGARCTNVGFHGHHVRKPRRAHHDPRFVLWICIPCHFWCDAAPQEKRGKLMAEPSASPEVAPRTWITRETKWERRSTR